MQTVKEFIIEQRAELVRKIQQLDKDMAAIDKKPEAQAEATSDTAKIAADIVSNKSPGEELLSQIKREFDDDE